MKKTVWILWGIVFFYTVFPINAQETHNIKLGFSLSVNEIGGSLKEKPSQVREYSTYPYDDFFRCGISFSDEWLTINQAAINAEYFVFKNRLGISGGLQFSECSSKLGSSKDYFFWELGQDGLTTDYLKIRNIKQDFYYLGIPLAGRFFFQKRERGFQFYVKIGLDMNYRIATNNKITFEDNAMDKYAKTVENQLKIPSPFTIYAYSAIGAKIGKFRSGSKIPWVNLEYRCPAFMLANASSFMRPEAGFGFQIALQFPIGKNVPIGSK